MFDSFKKKAESKQQIPKDNDVVVSWDTLSFSVPSVEDESAYYEKVYESNEDEEIVPFDETAEIIEEKQINSYDDLLTESNNTDTGKLDYNPLQPHKGFHYTGK